MITIFFIHPLLSSNLIEVFIFFVEIIFVLYFAKYMPSGIPGVGLKERI